ncbi:alpha/beta hydrolase domain-containing protein [Afifella pfennigii]|uniref:alpha/beta hydrolase domain-containing protein n=1 Tax=Afifella pfennigii TaxID=209897 RepID=UPI000691D0F7|nr:alpha/beta hydrolase domain-containing protein [Afifella pfennigii]
MSAGVRLQIDLRSGFAGGARFGEAGAYEKLKGRAHFAVDPEAPGEAGIADIAFAPREGDGSVAFAADFLILKPVDPARGNRRLFFDWGNRGNIRALQHFNDAPAGNDPESLADAGNGFLFRRGYALAWLAWQGDLWPGDGRMIFDAPVARKPEAPITGLIRREYVVEREGITTLPLSGMVSVRSYPAVSRDTAKARLTRRRCPQDARETIPPFEWCFARLESGQGLDAQGAESALIPSAEHIHLKAGFKPGWIYELVYEARDPLVLGLGYAGVRDFLAFLRREKDGEANPLAGAIDKVYGWGRSQTGRALRDFIYRGFNADPQGGRVFDAVMPHVSGAGRMWLNHRFAQGSAMAGQQYEAHENFADRFPFAYGETTDHLTGKTDAILKRPDNDPLVIHTQSSTEYWQRRGSLVHTDTKGSDLDEPPGVRLYLFASTQHFLAPAEPTRNPACQLAGNVVPTAPFFRALLDALDRWASQGVPPPPSRVPRRADDTLVAYADWRKQFVAIPGVALPASPNDLPLFDYGPEEEEGVLQEPPRLADAEGYVILVPSVDADGNEVAGLRAPLLAAPLGTYTGWNLRTEGQGKGALHQFSGGTIPFPQTRGERQMSGDPRPSIAERYGDADTFRQAVLGAAQRLQAEGFLLEEDVERIAREAANWYRPRHDVDL